MTEFHLEELKKVNSKQQYNNTSTSTSNSQRESVSPRWYLYISLVNIYDSVSAFWKSAHHKCPWCLRCVSTPCPICHVDHSESVLYVWERAEGGINPAFHWGLSLALRFIITCLNDTKESPLCSLDTIMTSQQSAAVSLLLCEIPTSLQNMKIFICRGLNAQL